VEDLADPSARGVHGFDGAEGDHAERELMVRSGPLHYLHGHGGEERRCVEKRNVEEGVVVHDGLGQFCDH